jgi:hypothetical protein
MRGARSSVHVVSITTLFLWAALALPAELRADSLAGSVAKWCLGQLASYGAGKVLDLATSQDFHHQLEQEIPRLVTQIASAIGPQRAVLRESLELDREQLAVLTRLISSQGEEIGKIKVDQELLLRRIDSLTARMSKLERRVDGIDSYVRELDARVSQLEEALIRECLDLRRASVLGADELRVKESPDGWIADHFESKSLRLDMRLLLNSCTKDLTQRGLLIQMSLVTRDLDKDMSLYATFKGVESGGRMGVLSRQEIPLARPGYRVDGQVVELFFPYSEIPDLSSPDRIALALVLTHDGEVLYTLPDRVISCVFGQRVNCRWGR